MHSLILYSRPGCHLCELLLDELRPMLGPSDEVRIVDISENADLTRRYGLRIPVLHTGTQELSAWPFDRARVASYLKSRNS